jgi:hypothetical protein
MRMPSKLLFLTGSLALLAYGLAFERHEIRSLADDSPQRITGPAFLQGATVDEYVRRNGRLYNVYSLSPLETNIKDCKT